MKQHPCITQRRVLRTALSAATLAILVFSGGALAASATQSGEQKNMRRVGHTDLQGRPSYQPNVIQYPDGRFIAFAGTHNNIPVPRPGFTFLPNPLNGSKDEPNGTMMIDVTDPANPKEIVPYSGPGRRRPGANGALCLGSDLPQGDNGQGLFVAQHPGEYRQSGYEVWDVTDVQKPVLASALRDIRSTHKVWWECNTGIAYMPGSKDTRVPYGVKRSPWSSSIGKIRNAAPIYIRTLRFGRWATRLRPGPCPPRSMVRSRRTSIPMRPTSSAVGQQPTTSSGTVFTQHGASVTMA